MTRGKFTAKQVFEQKINRLKMILKKLREKSSLNSSEIAHLFYGLPLQKNQLRTIQNYLAELIALELIYYDPEQGLYFLKENKLVFKSEQDRIFAIDHSKRIILSNGDIQRLDQMDRYLALDKLAFFNETNDENIEDKLLLQHIKTGYHEIYSLLQEYKKTSIDLGLTNVSSLPISIPDIEDTIEPTDFILNKSKKKKANRQSDPKIIKAQNLRDLLIGKLQYFVHMTNHNNPLGGVCELCLNRNTEIKDG